ncbi:hypothetical protein [Lunatibacter salilacus]|uniref:hypothetical protein n=1 Tax=Lunatibacter salilacus TaxID=2483804 RepID=UPI00131BF9B9|nr:hypothetical protein [Lunatibacter salilacus]
MNKLILISFGLICNSLACFGQNSFKLHGMPSVVGTIPAFLDNPLFGFEKIGNVPEVENSSGAIVQYELILSFKPEIVEIPHIPDVSFSDGSNMPIIDLSKGYSSNFPIKEFSKDFRSNMPITDLRGPNLIIFPED